jgi:hypothetical protein
VSENTLRRGAVRVFERVGTGGTGCFGHPCVSTPVQTYHINGATKIDSGVRAACGGKRPMTATPLTTAAWPNGRTS